MKPSFQSKRTLTRNAKIASQRDCSFPAFVYYLLWLLLENTYAARKNAHNTESLIASRPSILAARAFYTISSIWRCNNNIRLYNWDSVSFKHASDTISSYETESSWKIQSAKVIITTLLSIIWVRKMGIPTISGHFIAYGNCNGRFLSMRIKSWMHRRLRNFTVSVTPLRKRMKSINILRTLKGLKRALNSSASAFTAMNSLVW